jgi:hypothetical protein
VGQVKPQRNPDHIQEFHETYRQIEDSAMHTQLNNDLIEHHWAAAWRKMIPYVFI